MDMYFFYFYFQTGLFVGDGVAFVARVSDLVNSLKMLLPLPGKPISCGIEVNHNPYDLLPLEIPHIVMAYSAYPGMSFTEALLQEKLLILCSMAF